MEQLELMELSLCSNQFKLFRARELFMIILNYLLYLYSFLIVPHILERARELKSIDFNCHYYNLRILIICQIIKLKSNLKSKTIAPSSISSMAGQVFIIFKWLPSYTYSLVGLVASTSSSSM